MVFNGDKSESYGGRKKTVVPGGRVITGTPGCCYGRRWELSGEAGEKGASVNDWERGSEQRTEIEQTGDVKRSN